jgi:hypothetical protein
MAQPVSIPLSFVELVVRYEHPNVLAFNDRAAVLQTIFDALHPWSPKLDDVEPTVFCRVRRDNIDWSESEETIVIFEAALTALIKLTGLSQGPKTAAVGVHLQPKTGTFMDILSPFPPPQITGLEQDCPKTMASVVRWQKRKITLDGSSSLANAAFLKFEREFDAAATFSHGLLGFACVSALAQIGAGPLAQALPTVTARAARPALPRQD